MVRHEVFTFVDKVPEGASMTGSRWVMGRKLMGNGIIEKWKVRLLSRGNLQKPGDYNDITSAVIDMVLIRLALGLPAKHDVEFTIPDIPTAFLGIPLHENLFLPLPEGEWPDPYGLTGLFAMPNKTLYGIKQANRDYYEEVLDFIVDDLSLQASVAAPGLCFGGNLETHGVWIPVWVDDSLIISTLVPVASIESPLQDRFKEAGHVPLPNTFQYLDRTVIRDNTK